MQSSISLKYSSSPPSDESYMYRCLELAGLAIGYTAPNPMVGAVLVHGEKIIAEGYHQAYGQAHAEVNCLRSVPPEHEHLVPSSVLYVSLEPCAHYGKTPPCADLIIEKKIPKVVVGCRDPFREVDGKGIEKLKSAGIVVKTGILEKECRELNRRFMTFHTRYRPYIILKWAQGADGRIANQDRSRVLITNEITNRLVHQWRSEESAVMVGTNTALYDNPVLTTRLYPGPDPVRLVVDMDLRLPHSLHLFDQAVKTIVFNSLKHEELPNLLFYQVTREVSLVPQVLHALYQMNIGSVLIEGGTRLLQSFIDDGAWDEARVITNRSLWISGGIPAPSLPGPDPIKTETVLSDSISYFRNF